MKVNLNKKNFGKSTVMMALSTLLFTLLLTSPAYAAPLNVVTTIPDLAEVVRRIGGDQVTVKSLLSGNEDPHYADAAPDFVMQAASADVLCAMGLDLEVGWLPKVLAKSGNGKVQKNGLGHCDLGSKIETLDVPQGPIDRSMGHIHKKGNPHFNLSPKSLSQAAVEVAAVLSKNKPDQKQLFTQNLERFKSEMSSLETKIQETLKPAVELSREQAVVVQYHQEFRYFFETYGIKSLGSIEEKPGVPPSAARLAEISMAAKSGKVKVALAAQFAPEKHLRRFSELSGVPHKKVPAVVQNRGEFDSIEKVQMAIAKAISGTISGASSTSAQK